MEYLLLIISLFIVIGIPIIRLIASCKKTKRTSVKFKQYKNNQDQVIVDEEVEKIIVYAKQVINNLRNELNIDYVLLMYEEIFFFYFLNDVKLVEKNISENFREKILNRIFESFEYTKNTGFKENRKLINDIFNLRMKYYSAIFAKYNLNYTVDFFMAIFEYQEELLASIIKNKTFSYYNPVPSSPMDYSKKEVIGLCSNYNIMTALSNNIKIITQFIAN